MFEFSETLAYRKQLNLFVLIWANYLHTRLKSLFKVSYLFRISLATDKNILWDKKNLTSCAYLVSLI